jgi:hypothetical protein
VQMEACVEELRARNLAPDGQPQQAGARADEECVP